MIENILDELWENGFELLEGGSLGHLDFNCVLRKNN